MKKRTLNSFGDLVYSSGPKGSGQPTAAPGQPDLIGRLIRHATAGFYATTAWEMVRQGLGIGTMMDEIAQQTPGVVRVLDEVPAVRFPVWLVTHRELHTARRIRCVFDLLADELRSG